MQKYIFSTNAIAPTPTTLYSQLPRTYQLSLNLHCNTLRRRSVSPLPVRNLSRSPTYLRIFLLGPDACTLLRITVGFLLFARAEQRELKPPLKRLFVQTFYKPPTDPLLFIQLG
jgi:hypothetical protein